jgi:hypothetical protein
VTSRYPPFGLGMMQVAHSASLPSMNGRTLAHCDGIACHLSGKRALTLGDG